MAPAYRRSGLSPTLADLLAWATLVWVEAEAASEEGASHPTPRAANHNAEAMLKSMVVIQG